MSVSNAAIDLVWLNLRHFHKNGTVTLKQLSVCFQQNIKRKKNNNSMNHHEQGQHYAMIETN